MKKLFLYAGVASSLALALGAAIFLQGQGRTQTIPEESETTIPEIVEAPAAVEPSEPTTEPVPKGIPQFVVLAFDGSYDLDMWKATRAFAAESAAYAAPVHFTYFINSAYLLDPSTKFSYAPPQHPVGTSAINFAPSAKNIASRVEQINLAISEGHEIGSHAVGHFDGSTWSQTEWTSELTQFQTHIAASGIQLPPGGIVGFRAPELGVSDGLYPTLKQLGYRYDASASDYMPDAWPVKNDSGLWEYPVHHIPYNGTDHEIQAMDYTLYFQQTNAQDTLTKGTPEWQTTYDDTLQTYLNAFHLNSTTTRAPVFMANHFSLWNDGLYWEVMKAFAKEVCGVQDVHCISFSELTDYLDAQTSPPVDSPEKAQNANQTVSP